jgi:TonB family protein
MRKLYVAIVVLSLSYALGPSGQAQSQQSNPETGRKVVRRVEPVYPSVAKRINLSGTVKVVAVVAPDGKVKKVELVGGSPILGQAAEMAVFQWKYVPGSESRETIELHFNP